MIHYSEVFQTGVQSLLAVACGWSCGKWKVLEPDPTVQYTNTLVLKFCIPCLQIWLLAIKTDMREPGNWSALAVFLLWSVSLQLLLALHQLVTQHRVQLAQWGVDSLLLTTNNTGILGPVVIQAAVGVKYAPLGMLATVVLYFQQLPSAQLLFQLQQAKGTAAVAAATSAVGSTATAGQYKNMKHWQQQQQQQLSPATSNGDLCSSMQHLELADTSFMLPPVAAAAAPPQIKDHASPPPLTPVSAAAAALHELSLEEGLVAAGNTLIGGLQHRKHITSADASRTRCLQQQQGSDQQVLYVHHDEITSSTAHNSDEESPCLGYNSKQQQYQYQQQWEQAVLLSNAGRQLHGQQQQVMQQQSIPAMVMTLLLKNSLVWSTGVSLLLSCIGSSTLLDPDSPLAIQHIAFLERMLGWFAQTTAPLTLFTTGLWMYSNSEKQQQQQQRLLQQQGLQNTVTLPQDDQLSWNGLCMYLLARATIAPALMVFISWVLGFRGDLAHALVILSLLPVAQTAFVVCKQHDTGMHAVSCVMVGSLLLMLPQLMVMLAVLEWLGVFA